MSTTRWELRRALSNQLRAVWDAKRDGVMTWEASFEAARDCLVYAMERDAKLLREMTWQDFQDFQGLHEQNNH